jgi:hypothetical protein
MKPIIAIAGLLMAAASPMLSQSSSHPPECLPVLENCSQPVKWIADKGDCSCYACEYDKKTVHTGCTRDKQMKAELLKLQADSGDDTLDAVTRVMGTFKEAGGKYTFVDDKDGKTWEVTNPDALKGSEGHHVVVSGHLYANKDQIHVMGVKMMKAPDKEQGKN